MILWQMFTLSKKSNLGKLPIEIQDRRRMYLTLGDCFDPVIGCFSQLTD